MLQIDYLIHFPWFSLILWSSLHSLPFFCFSLSLSLPYSLSILAVLMSPIHFYLFLPFLSWQIPIYDVSYLSPVRSPVSQIWDYGVRLVPDQTEHRLQMSHGLEAKAAGPEPGCQELLPQGPRLAIHLRYWSSPLSLWSHQWPPGADCVVLKRHNKSAGISSYPLLGFGSVRLCV